MDTDVVEQSGPGQVADGTVGPGNEPGAPEATIDEVDSLLDEVEAALTRLDEGTYGVCQQCGGLIDDIQLSGLPTAMTCATCETARAGSDPDDRGQFEEAEVVGTEGDRSEAGIPGELTPSPWAVRAFPEA